MVRVAGRQPESVEIPSKAGRWINWRFPSAIKVLSAVRCKMMIIMPSRTFLASISINARLHFSKELLVRLTQLFLLAASWLALANSVIAARYIFWTDPTGPSGSHVIKRANADGSNVQTIVTGLRDPRGMTVD